MSQSSDYSPENPVLDPSTITFGKEPDIPPVKPVPGLVDAGNCSLAFRQGEKEITSWGLGQEMRVATYMGAGRKGVIQTVRSASSCTVLTI